MWWGAYAFFPFVNMADWWVVAVVLWAVGYWSKHRLFADVGGIIVADLCITAGMVYYLGIRLRGQAMRTKGTFHDIITRTIQANTLSLFSQVASFALFNADVGLYFLLTDFTVVKVYAFSLIVSLNTRKGASDISSASGTSGPAGISLSHLSSAIFRGGARPAPNISIDVHQDVEVEADSWEHSGSSTHHKVDPELALNQDKKAEARTD
ncbi:hypothetical protein DXG01_014317 [Tephrocybe rancida]|nr:hypothetical protein DXG01_014317 [Tephrocybe rancida]